MTQADRKMVDEISANYGSPEMTDLLRRKYQAQVRLARLHDELDRAGQELDQADAALVAECLDIMASELAPQLAVA